MQGIEGAQRRRKRLRSPGQHRAPQQDEIDGFEPFGDRLASSHGFVDRQCTLETEPVERPQGLDGQQLAGDEAFAGPQPFQGAGLPKNESEQR